MNRSLLIICFIFCQLISGNMRAFSQKPQVSIDRLLKENKTDTGQIRLLLGTAMSYVLKAGNLSSDMDSARSLVNKALQLSGNIHSMEWEGRCFYVYSNIFREEGNTTIGKDYARRAIVSLSKTTGKNELANCYVELARYYDPYNDNDLQEKIKLNEQAALFFRQAGNREAAAQTFKHLGELSVFNGNYKKALLHLEEALTIFKQIHYKDLQGVYDLMCNACRQMGDYTKALQYGLSALKTAEAQKDSSAQLSAICNHVGATLYYLGKPAEAAGYYEKGIQVTTRNKDSAATIIIVHNLANAYTYGGQPQKSVILLKSIEKKFPLTTLYDKIAIYTSLLSAYTELKQYDAAKIYFGRLLNISSGLPLTDGLQSDIYSAFIKYLMAVKRFDDVAKYCAYNELLCKIGGFVNRVKATNYSYWYKADSARGHFDSALSHYQQMVALNDTLFSEAKARQISELQIQYETEKKDNDIQLLVKQDQLQKNELKQAAVIRNVTLIAVALLIIVLGLLFNRYRLKQKANQELQLKQQEINEQNISLQHLVNEKEWLLKEVHHRVKNNLQTIICLLESQAMYLEKDALQAIEKSQHRIYAMSLIHQKLYQNEDLQLIDMSVYLQEFIGYLKDSFDTQQIEFVIQVEPVSLNLQQAIPVALIINEGVTNAIKYAFGTEADPKIHISMTEAIDKVKLVIADNGSGFELKSEDEEKSLGMQLIKGLGRELKGTVSIDTKTGTSLCIEFSKDPLNNKISPVQEDTIG
jgi:two-component sensor histidine kinase